MTTMYRLLPLFLYRCDYHVLPTARSASHCDLSFVRSAYPAYSENRGTDARTYRTDLLTSEYVAKRQICENFDHHTGWQISDGRHG